AATTPGQTASYTGRIPTTCSGDIQDALRQVAAICDQRITGLAQLAADQRPAWATALGPIPEDAHSRAQWAAQAAVVIAYRARSPVPRTEPSGPEPSHRAPARWAAWHRAQTVIGVATVAGQVRTATDAQLRQLIAAQRAADANAPTYVGDYLRAEHLRLAAVE